MLNIRRTFGTQRGDHTLLVRRIRNVNRHHDACWTAVWRASDLITIAKFIQRTGQGSHIGASSGGDQRRYRPAQ